MRIELADSTAVPSESFSDDCDRGAFYQSALRRIRRSNQMVAIVEVSRPCCLSELDGMRTMRAPFGSRRRVCERKRGRAVECTGLENRQALTSLVSSNLTASAKTKTPPRGVSWFWLR